MSARVSPASTTTATGTAPAAGVVTTAGREDEGHRRQKAEKHDPTVHRLILQASRYVHHSMRQGEIVASRDEIEGARVPDFFDPGATFIATGERGDA